jgi:hypothetical protein
VGRKVVFFRTMTEYQGKPVPCIRFRTKDEVRTTQTEEDPDNILQGDDDIPFE